ncbi:uncharacterized protein LOC126681767 [Mercurialis annua]|uniref:uncharacterized protein LOC126681767 n=1 Tax=Mercurialis annua TaxID=3986 RepID=UPI00215DF2CA|nr:uncharacterized protein LOC126681767 [Mercurialis annua]
MTHLSCFQVAMGVQSVSDATVCKVFPSTLSDAAQKWYQNLKEGSITSFRELAMAFKTHFTPSIERKKRSSDLKKCFQKQGESLKAYIARFNAEAIMIEDLNDDTAIDAMKDNTSMQVFRDSLITNLVDTYTELMDRAWNYINLDEERQRKVYGMASPHGAWYEAEFQHWGGTEGYVDRAGVPKQYVPLNTPREQILSWIKHNNEEIRYPPRLVKDGDWFKFCEFHDGYGHETEECGRLRSEIDKLVSQGRLQHFVVAKEGQDRGNTRVNSVSRKRRKKKQKIVMSVSTGSPRPSIVFGPEDAKGVEFPHEDALIVSAIIGSKWVKRLLVDDGSSVNLLTLSVFLTMGGSKTDLKPVNIPLLGLGGAPVIPEGMVELDLELGIEIPQEDGTKGILAEPTRKVQ